MRLKISKQKLTLIFLMLVFTLTLFCFPINKVKAANLSSLEVVGYETGLVPSFSPTIHEYDIEIYENDIDLFLNYTKSNDSDEIILTNNKYLVSNSGTVILNVSGTEYKINYIKNKIKYSDFLIDNISTFSYTGNYQTFVTPKEGYYKIELWGAQGGTGDYVYGRGYGGYTSGFIKLPNSKSLYVYVGNQGTSSNYTGAWNGGGLKGQEKHDGSGGGSTDIRLVPTSSLSTWNEFNSLKSRIMVAAGGGGSDDTTPTSGNGSTGGAGGGLEGIIYYSGSPSYVQATQTHGGYVENASATGGFGYGNQTYNSAGSGGGGGYYGGGGTDYGGQGGSSFISGHDGCDAIAEGSTSNNIIHTGQSIHYSDYKFTNTTIVDGEGYKWTTQRESKTNMPTYDGADTMSGNANSGYAKITELSYLSRDYYLANLSVEGGTLSPTFDPIIDEYSINLDKYDQDITISGTLSNSNAVATGFGKYNIANGETKVIKIIVTAQSGEFKEYTITVTRDEFQASEHTSKLKTLYVENYETNLNPKFHPLINEYNLDILSIDIDLNIGYETYDPDAIVTISGNKYLKNNKGVITIMVNAPNVENTSYEIKYQKFEIAKTNFEYIGEEELFVSPIPNKYKLEVWGAQGGTSSNKIGGYGSYSTGEIILQKNDVIYINVGQQPTTLAGGYNGGGTAGGNYSARGGGGATHIATQSGILSSLKNENDSILIVAGGGGGADHFNNGSNGGNAGGYKGANGSLDGWYGGLSNATGGTQLSGGTASSGACTGTNGSFGQGGSQCSNHGGGGGGGYYGGGGGAYNNGVVSSGGGGSGYIGNSLLTNKKMVMYSTDTSFVSEEENTLTEITTNVSDEPISEYAKIGSGYAKITPIRGIISEDNYLSSLDSDKGILSPSFSPLIDEYTLIIDKYNKEFTLSAISSDENAIIIGTGLYEMETVKERTIKIVVTAEDGSERIYTVKAIRENLTPGEHSSKIKKLELYGISYQANLDPKFDSLTEHYSIDIYNDERNIKVKYVLYDNEANVNIYGNVSLENQGTIIINVSAPGVSDTIYYIDYEKTFDSVAQFSYTGSYQTFTAPATGDYQLEVWGASGGGGSYAYHWVPGGAGGYSRGTISLSQGEELYVFVGGAGTTGGYNVPGGWNGGNSVYENDGHFHGSGGGATDIRTVSGDWNNSTSLLSRFIVAGGGGGGHGETSRPSYSRGGAGGGVSGNSCYLERNSCRGGAGGGWNSSGASGSGGSSGHGGAGFILTEETVESTATNYIPTEKYYLTDATTIVGDQSVPTYDGTSSMTGNSGNGHAKISLIKKISDNNYLLSLTSNRGTFNKQFNYEDNEYTLNLTKYDEYFILSGELQDNYSTVTGLGKYEIDNGEETDIDVVVTAENGDPFTYTIHAIREDFEENEHTSKLKSLVINGKDYEADLSPSFYPLTYSYEIDISNSEVNLDINYLTYDEEAEVTIEGNEYFTESSGSIVITVKEPHVDNTIYVINYTKSFNDVDSYEYTGDYQTFTAPFSGEYKLEVWGAQGGGNTYAEHNIKGGSGGYSKGTINLNKGDKLYIYVGSQGQAGNEIAHGGYNGGSDTSWNDGHVYGAGGGATDIRLIPGEWNNSTSLLSRIIVAGGGGGGHGETSRPSYSTGGAGGGTDGIKCSGTTAFGTEQCHGAPGGGWNDGTTGSGGSSGHGGSGWIYTEDNTENVPTGYIPTSKYYLTDAETIAGNQAIPTHDGTSTITGNLGNGYAKITSVGEARDNNNYLSSLSSSDGIFVPEFNPLINNYKLYTHNKSFTLTGIPDSEKALVLGDGEIDTDNNKNITISVTSESGEERLYTVEIIDNASSNTNITSFIPGTGTLSPAFDNEINNYDLIVDNDTSIVNIDVGLEDENATVEGNTNISVDSNEKEIIISVIAEDKSKRDIKVTIKRAVSLEDISIESNEITLIKGDTKEIVITTIPEGINLTYLYELNNNIATIENNVITALNEGTTTIIVRCEEDSNIEKSISLTVLNNKITSNIYSVRDIENENELNDRIVIGSEVGITIAEFKSNLDNPQEMINIYDTEGTLLTDEDIVRTGLIIKLENNNIVYDEAVMVVRGDIDGDGIVDVTDESLVLDDILNLTPIEGYGRYAADVIEDEILDVSDDSNILDYILNLLNTLN